MTQHVTSPTVAPSPLREHSAWWRVQPWVSTAARLLLAVVWFWAALAKITDPGAATRSVRAYRILPEVLVQPIGWGLPFLELALGVLLLIGLGTRIAALLSGGLLVVFMAGIASAWARGLQIDCGCFSGGGDDATVHGATYVRELLRDTGFLLVAGYLAWQPWSRFALDGHGSGDLDDLDDDLDDEDDGVGDGGDGSGESRWVAPSPASAPHGSSPGRAPNRPGHSTAAGAHGELP